MTHDHRKRGKEGGIDACFHGSFLFWKVFHVVLSNITRLVMIAGKEKDLISHL